MVQIKGAALLARIELVNNVAPGDGMARVLARLPKPDRDELHAVLASKWYPFDLGSRFDEAIVQELAGGDRRFFERIGEASAERNLHGVHKGFLVAGDPHAFLARAPQIYSFYYDKGRREYERTGDTEGVLTTYEAETFSSADCATVIGWYRKALEMCGAKKPRIAEEECRALGGKVCRYRLSWS